MSKSNFQNSFDQFMLPFTQQLTNKFGTEQQSYECVASQLRKKLILEVKDSQSFIIFNKILILNDNIYTIENIQAENV